MTYIIKSESVGVLSPSAMFPQDIGKNWSAGISVGSSIGALTYAGNGIVIAGDANNGNIYRSTDYGATWSAGILVGSGIYALTYAGNGIVIAGDANIGNIYRSTDYGLTWSVVTSGTIRSLTYAGDGIVIARDSITAEIRYSTDYGLTWIVFGSGDAIYIYALTYAGNGIVIAADNGNGYIHRSTDYGLTWSPGTSVGYHLYALTYVGNGIVIAGDDRSNIYRSTDYGLTWGASISLEIVYAPIYTLTYAGNGIVIAGSGNGNIYRSTDYGLTWGAGISVGSSIYTLAYAGNGIVIAGDNSNGNIYRSDISYKTDERASNFPVPYSQLKINDSILTSDILSTEFNEADKLLKLDGSALTPTAQLGSGAAGVTTFLRGDQSWQVPSGGAAVYDVSRYRRVGATADRWYTVMGLAISTKVQIANKLIAVPIVVPINITLDNIAIKVTTLAAGNARLGIYNDDGNMYPNALVLDAGTVDTSTTGVKTISINQALTGNNLYWLVVVFNATPTVNGFTIGRSIPELGNDNTLPLPTTDPPAMGWVADFAYDVLPATFPAGATAYGTGAYLYPAIYFRMSA